MTQPNSGRPRSKKAKKPKKPHPAFPLFAHANGQWCRKVRGDLKYFGAWDDPDAALARWLDEKDDLLAGRIPRAKRLKGEWILKDLFNRFLTDKSARVESGELSRRSLDDYHSMCKDLHDVFGGERLVSDITSDDFAALRRHWAKRWGLERLRTFVTKVRTLFNYAYKAEIIDVPVRYGVNFEPPSEESLRKHRNTQDPKTYTPEELHAILDQTREGMRAMILLGVNCGFGNADCGLLPLSAVDLANGWIDFSRPKTGIDRRCPLWPETVAALRGWLAVRPKPKDQAHERLVFITQKRESWHKGKRHNPLTKEFRKVMNEAEVGGHRGFYGLRHTFETIGGAAKDQVAVDAIMGHADESMAAVYRHGVEDERLRAVTDTVRKWLWAKQKVRKASTRHAKE